MRSSIALVGLPPEAGALVRRGLTVSGDAAEVLEVGAEEALARLGAATDWADAIVCWDPAGASGAAFAQRVGQADRDLAVVIVTAPGETDKLDRALRFAPFLGEDVTGWSSDELEFVGAEAADAAVRTRRRRSHQQNVVRASERLASVPSRRPGGYVENLLRHAPIGVATLDAGGTVVACNAEAARLLAVDRDRAAGRPFAELVPQGDQTRVRTLVSAARPEPGAVEVLELASEPRARFVEVSASRHIGPDEEPVTVAVIADVTERERAAARLSHLQSVTDAALAHLDLDALLNELMSRIRTALDVDTVAVLLPDENDASALRMRASQGLGDELQNARIPVGQGFAGRIARERRPLRIADVQERHVVFPAFSASVASLLGVPLVVGRELIGVLHVGSVRPREFDDDDEALLQLVGDRAALAINQAHSYAQEHETAVVLQRSLLPQQLPHLPALRLAATYQPGGPAVEVGGDWYDVIELDAGQVAVSIGDVVGRGLKAAAVMGQLRASLRAYAVEGHDAAGALSRLNDLVLHGGGGLATAVHGVWDPNGGCVHLAVAGHPPPLLLSADGHASFVEGDFGPALGVVPFTSYSDTTVPLGPGDRLVLYTDGLVERRDETIDDGLARLGEAAAGAGPDAQSLVDRLVERLLSSGEKDDAAVLVIEALALGSRIALDLPARPEAMAGARTHLRRWMISRGAPQAVAEDLIVACGEACANVIEHAYGLGKASFRLEAEQDGEDAILVVRDFGSWREQRHVGRGRGMTLMRALADEVTVDSGDGGTVVRIRRRLLDGGQG